MEPNTEDHKTVLQWQWSAKHTRLRYQLVVSSLLLSTCIVYDVKEVRFPFFPIIFEANETGPSVLMIIIMLAVFYVFTLISFWVLSVNEKKVKNIEYAAMREALANFSLNFGGLKSDLKGVEKGIVHIFDEKRPELHDINHSLQYEIENDDEISHLKEFKGEFFKNFPKVKTTIDEAIAFTNNNTSNRGGDPTGADFALGDTKEKLLSGLQGLIPYINQMNSEVELIERVEGSIRNWESKAADTIQQKNELLEAAKKMYTLVNDFVAQITTMITEMETGTEDIKTVIQNFEDEQKLNNKSFKWERWLGAEVPAFVSVGFIFLAMTVRFCELPI